VDRIVITESALAAGPEAPLASRLEACFRASWPHLGLPENARLSVEVLGFVRYRGDWLGAVITPVFVRLLLLPAGGELWGEIPPGQRRYVDVHGATLAFLAEPDAGFGAWQWADLCAGVADLPDMATARRVAQDGLQLATGLAEAGTPPTPTPDVSRRGFFRRLAGQRSN
jgi:[NiFe] hydrogenase assembly HybE family chaperone